MKKLFIILIIVLAGINGFAQTRGTTQREIDCNGPIAGQLKAYTPKPVAPQPAQDASQPKDEWLPIDSLQFRTVLRAGSQYGMQFYSPSETFIPATSMGTLTPAAISAIHKSPLCMQADLENVFSQLTTSRQDDWAAIINSAVDPVIDEIAFSIAHSSFLYLNSDYSDPALFVENAQKMYEIDADLAYVQIINYGTSTSNPDYYSTTSYAKTNSDGTISTVEVPRDIYYWYIVHPKITDEIPAYINPTLIENNSSHANNIAPPPDGKFWRSFFYDAQEGTYPVLSDTLSQCQTLFNRNGTGGDAIRTIQWWINHTMSFTSNNERPHQPVRIYGKHFGRCGEYADYTAAAARTALIPCTGILSASTDHTWNEFWEDGWVQWEPVNNSIDQPLVYEDGWGKVFGSVFEIRSDGFLTNVTERYSSGISNIHINVTDSLGVPVDGARLIVAIMDGTTNRFDTAVFTDNNGDVSFTVGDNRQYSVRVESTVGWYPQPVGTYVLVTENSVAGQNYDFQIELPYAKWMPAITQINAPQDNANDWRLAVTFNVHEQILSGVVAWDDIDVVGSQAIFYRTTNLPGTANLLMTDSDNYLFYSIAHQAEAFNVLSDVASGQSLFNVPIQSDWYAFLDGSNNVGNAQYISGTLRFEHYGLGTEDDVIALDKTVLHPNAPNPFHTETTIKYSLAKDSEVSASVYNIKGQKVASLHQGPAKAGLHTLLWNGSDTLGKSVGTGIYYLRLTEGKQTLTRKMLLVN